MTTARPILSITLLSASACAPPLEAGDDAMATDDGPSEGAGGPQVEHEDLGGGLTSTRVDASDEDAWVYLDLSDGEQLELADPRADPDWDLGFRRFHIKLNGGVSGEAGVEAAVLPGVTFEELEVAPVDGFGSDEPDGDDDGDEPDYVLQQWYEYDARTHVLTPAPVVYVIRHGDQHTKIQIESYYDDAGTSGHLSFRWASVAAPSP